MDLPRAERQQRREMTMAMNTPTPSEYMAKQAAAMAGQMSDYGLGKYAATDSPTERSALAEAHAAFKQADELCRYAEMVVSKLIGGGAVEGCSDDQKSPYGAFPVLLAEAVSIQRRMNEAMSALRRLESQLP
jgi:hypothetical protein